MQEVVQQAALLDGHGVGSKQERHKLLVVGAGRGKPCLVGRDEGIPPASRWVLPEMTHQQTCFWFLLITSSRSQQIQF